jgi:hypothetical protein
MSISRRKYAFQLPYQISGFRAHFAKRAIVNEGLFDNLPEDLQRRLTQAEATWTDVEITEDDLAKIDDDTWAAIALKLNLGWDYDD